MENRPESSLVVSLGKAHDGMSPPLKLPQASKILNPSLPFTTLRNEWVDIQPIYFKFAGLLFMISYRQLICYCFI